MTPAVRPRSAFGATWERQQIRHPTRQANAGAVSKDLSPVTHIGKGKNLPPFLIWQVADHPETRLQSQRLTRALQDVGVLAKAYPAAGKNRTTINAGLGLLADKPTQALFEFADGVLEK